MDVKIGEDGFSEIATFNCAPGYYVSGSSALHCEKGVWDGREPECKREYYQSIFTLEYICTATIIMYNECMVEYVVQKFLVQYNSISECSVNKTELAIVLIFNVSAAIDCGAPDAPLNGIVEFEDTRFMRIAHYKCDACHALKGYETRVCKRSGLWSKTTPECRPANGKQFRTLYSDMHNRRYAQKYVPLELMC